jgi:hypothetical protein
LEEPEEAVVTRGEESEGRGERAVSWERRENGGGVGKK